MLRAASRRPCTLPCDVPSRSHPSRHHVLWPGPSSNPASLSVPFSPIPDLVLPFLRSYWYIYTHSRAWSFASNGRRPTLSCSVPGTVCAHTHTARSFDDFAGSHLFADSVDLWYRGVVQRCAARA
ncbi:unnamed protein product [Parajaminaea phylloscopi]